MDMCLELARDQLNGGRVEVRRREHLVQLRLLLLELVGQRRQLLLEQQVLQAAFLLDLLDRLHELLVQHVALSRRLSSTRTIVNC